MTAPPLVVVWCLVLLWRPYITSSIVVVVVLFKLLRSCPCQCDQMLKENDSDIPMRAGASASGVGLATV